MKKLDPACFKGYLMAITNQGYVIPCCWCDTPRTLNDPEFKKLLRVSNINFYDDLEEMFNNEEWKNFYENLKQHKGPPACMNNCGYEDGSESKSKTKRIYTRYESDGSVKGKRII
tara:strand:- start:10901 stop:11245 length:345 start_codon:yes stop_codon:yes gene_type:complete